MLIAKGFNVKLSLVDGKVVSLPARAAILNDPNGKAWPANSCLIIPFRRTGEVVDDASDEARAFAKNSNTVRRGVASFPAPSDGWKKVGEVSRITYKRLGEHADWYDHEFDRPVLLRQCGHAYRLDLGKSAKLNWRGFVYP